MGAKDYIAEARALALQAVIDEVAADFDHSAGKCESPIERAFFYGLVAAVFETNLGLKSMAWGAGGGFTNTVVDGSPVCLHGDELMRQGATLLRERNGDVLTVWPQCHIGKARVDFLLILSGWPDRTTGLVVECDGHDFHEKTKEQARRDKARDRALQEAGFPIFRFAGSEIYADAAGCARRCIEFLESAMDKTLADAELRWWAERSSTQAGEQ